MAEERSKGKKTAPDKVLSLSGLNSIEVGTKSVKLASETNKLNPNSLRFLIGFMINVGFAGNRQDAADYLRKLPAPYASERKNLEGKRLNNKSIGDILNDDVHVAYWQLEAFARAFQMPVGAMLLLSRVLSHVRDNEPEKAKIDVQGTAKLTAVLSRIAQTQRLTEDDLHEIAACYHTDGQLSIFESKRNDDA